MKGYLREKIIGEGTFGTVWLVKSTVSQNLYVLKDINLTSMTENERQRALTEVTVLSKCRHNNIIRYKDSMIDSRVGSLSILMEYADGGDLLTAIKNQKGIPFLENIVLSWFVQISLALQYIHFSNILHRDLKCTNIFLTKNKVIKVGDFGVARVLRDSDDLATTSIGTPYYISPEMCRRQPYNCKSDIWALGIILFEMSALEHPFESRNFPQLVTGILNGRRKTLPDWSGPVIQVLVEDLLNPDPIQRPSADDILANPLLQPYLARISTPSKLPYLIDDKKLNQTKTLQKNGGFKRASETDLSPDKNKVRFTSTGMLNVPSNIPMSLQINHKKTKTENLCPYERSNTTDDQDLKKDGQRQTSLRSTFLVPSCAQNKREVLPDVKVNYFIPRAPKKLANEKSKRSKSLKDSGNKNDRKGVQKMLDFNVSNDTNFFSSTSSSTKPACKHSQCHQCMIDTLWKNRIRGCPKTCINNDEYSELKSKLLSVFKKNKFDRIYLSLLNDWNDIGDVEISNKKYTKCLNYEQVEHLPLMMQLIQLDMMRESLKKDIK